MREEYSPEFWKILEQLEITCLVEKILDWLSAGDSDFSVLERLVREEVMKVEREANALGLASLDIEHDEIEIGGVRYTKGEPSSRTFTGLAGEFSVNRHLYHPKGGGRSVAPLELRAGIVAGQWTPMAAEVMAHSTAVMTPYEAEDLLRKFGGFSPSRSSLDRLPKSLSEKWETNRWEWENAIRSQATVPAEAETLAISLDGIKLPMKDGDKAQKRAAALKAGKEPRGPNGYREASCGTVTLYDSDDQRLETIYYGRMPESKKPTLHEQLEAEASSILQVAGTLNVVFQSDGAKDNWRILGEIEESLRQQGLLGSAQIYKIVDFFHAAEHLKSATDLYYGTNSAKSKAVWAEMRHYLLEEDDGVDRVIRKLTYFRNRARKGTQRRKKLTRELKYFRTRRAQMAYAEFQRLKLPIGTGINEAACKTLVTQRMKRSGMRWGLGGGQGILTLRSLLQSDRWEEGWVLLAASHRPPIQVVTRVRHLEMLQTLDPAA